MWTGIGVGLTVAVLNGLVSWLLLLRWAVTRGDRFFVQIFLGGITGRLILVGGISLLVLLLLPIHRVGYVVSLLAGYLVFLIAEVLYLQNRLKKKKMDTAENDRLDE